jgi:hypothetical protein
VVTEPDGPTMGRTQVTSDLRFWHVNVTVAGDVLDLETVRMALVRLAQQHSFLHSLRYSFDRAEVSYWEQADTMLDAAAMGLRLWDEHREAANLPRWEVVGLEVLERDTFNQRAGAMSVSGIGLHRPMPLPF